MHLSVLFIRKFQSHVDGKWPCIIIFLVFYCLLLISKKGSFMPVSSLRIFLSWVVDTGLFPTNVFWINSQMNSVVCLHDSGSLHYYICGTDYL